MAVNSLRYPRFQAFDSSGDPLGSGKVYTYVVGTTTDQTTWTDSTKNTANANPVILDAAGEADIWYDTPIKLKIDDLNDVQQTVIDNLPVTGILTTEYVFKVTLGTADDQHIVIPVAGTVKTIYSVIDRALTTADETLTFKNNAGASMTGGVITVTQSGSADGDIDSTTPTANNTFTTGQKITVSIGGENGTAVLCSVTVVVTL